MNPISFSVFKPNNQPIKEEVKQPTNTSTNEVAGVIASGSTPAPSGNCWVA